MKIFLKYKLLYFNYLKKKKFKVNSKVWLIVYKYIIYKIFYIKNQFDLV